MVAYIATSLLSSSGPRDLYMYMSHARRSIMFALEINDG